MRLVVMVSSLGAGGAERVATTLCNAWAERGDNVTLVVTHQASSSSFYRLADNVEIVYLAHVLQKGRAGLLRYANKLSAIRSVLVRAAPDVLISFLPNVNVAAVLSSAFLDIPLILCERSDPLARRTTWYWRLATRLTYPRAAILTAQTQSAAAKLKAIYKGVRRITFIPNPLPDEVLRHGRELVADRKRVLSLGRLSEEKQVGKIVLAFAEVAAEFPEWDLHIYGDGPEKSALEEKIFTRGLGERILLFGRTNEPWEIMSRCDIFTMTSKFEGFPNALLEAMGIGLPCISFDCPSGPREITDHGRRAILVPLDDDQALVAGLRRLMRHEEERLTMGGNARDWVISQFSLCGVLEAWDRLFLQARRPA